MNDPSTPPLDWDGIFDRAHRRLFSRLILLTAIGALGALLLLGGGLSARGAVRWKLGPFGNAKVAKRAPSKVNVSPRVAIRRPSPSPPIDRPPPKDDGDKATMQTSRKALVLPPPPIRDEDPPCPDDLDSADEQYEECLPEPTDAAENDENTSIEGPKNGGTESSEAPVTTTPDQSDLSDAIPESVPAG